MRNCADTARHKITAAAACFPMEGSAADRAELLAALEIMRSKIGTKTPYAFPTVPEKHREAVVGFWNQVVAAYCFCMANQRHIVAGIIAQTLDRLKVLLERE
ncbi:MAG: hypothetical protein FWC77_01685 [Defluviitaleaceae bacterium]|nr:hypothetical protein [Defluviitaleaceae bacterium]